MNPRIYAIRDQGGNMLEHFYQAGNEEEAEWAAEEDGYLVSGAMEMVTGIRFEYVEPDYVGPLRRLPDPEIPVPGNCATDPQTVDDNGPEETERDRKAGLGPDHDRLTLTILYAESTSNSFGMDVFNEVLNVQAYLNQARRGFGWPDSVTWVVVSDDIRNAEAEVTFIAPRGGLETSVILEFEF
jgi:hypothetical protein